MLPGLSVVIAIEGAVEDFNDPDMSTEEALIANTPIIGGFYDAVTLGNDIGELIW